MKMFPAYSALFPAIRNRLKFKIICIGLEFDIRAHTIAIFIYLF